MNVNIITRHAPVNYGSLLQAIATQRVIESLGHECEIVDYVPYCETGARIAFTQLKHKKDWSSNVIKRMLYIAVAEPETLVMYKKFANMRRKYLRMGRPCRTMDELKVTYKNDTDSVYMTGSDQVWGPIATGIYDLAYFLEFAPKGSRKTAFSSSFGKAVFDDKTLEEYRQYLSKYNAVAVREDSAVELISNMGIHAEQVLDPTLLLNAKEWKKYITPIKKPDKYVLVYQIHNNPKLDRYAKKFADHVGLPLVRVSPLLHQIKRGGKFIYLPDIGGFLDLVKNAECMVTDSFHGTAFAINFNTQFVEMLPNNDSGTRNASILKVTGLESRIVTENNFTIANKKIDFTKANRILDRKRQESIDILKDMIEN